MASRGTIHADLLRRYDGMLLDDQRAGKGRREEQARCSAQLPLQFFKFLDMANDLHQQRQARSTPDGPPVYFEGVSLAKITIG